MQVYKIRRKSDGLYSEAGAGGPWIRFSETGKTWNHLRHVVTHINSAMQQSSFFGKQAPYAEGCEIVVFDLVELTAVAPRINRVKRLRTVDKGKVR